MLANRGTVYLKEFRGRFVQFVDALPPTDFHIVTIDLKDYVSDGSQSRGSRGRQGRAPLGPEGSAIRRRRSTGTEPIGNGDQTGMYHRVEFSEADLDRLASLGELRSLTFASSAVTDDVLARLKGLTKLKYLGLEGATITDAGLASLSGMPN